MVGLMIRCVALFQCVLTFHLEEDMLGELGKLFVPRGINDNRCPPTRGAGFRRDNDERGHHAPYDQVGTHRGGGVADPVACDRHCVRQTLAVQRTGLLSPMGQFHHQRSRKPRIVPGDAGGQLPQQNSLEGMRTANRLHHPSTSPTDGTTVPGRNGDKPNRNPSLAHPVCQLRRFATGNNENAHPTHRRPPPMEDRADNLPIGNHPEQSGGTRPHPRWKRKSYRLARIRNTARW